MHRKVSWRFKRRHSDVLRTAILQSVRAGFLLLCTFDLTFQARAGTQPRQGKSSANLILRKWLTVLLRTTIHASRCYSGSQPKIQIYNIILYHLESLCLQLFCTLLFHDLEVWIYMYIYKYDSPVTAEEFSVSLYTQSASIQQKYQLLCTSNPLNAGWFSAQHAS